MNAAGNDITIHIPVSQRSTGVRAMVIEREELSADIEYPNPIFVHDKHSGFARWDIRYTTDRYEMPHRTEPVVNLDFAAEIGPT